MATAQMIVDYETSVSKLEQQAHPSEDTLLDAVVHREKIARTMASTEFHVTDLKALAVADERLTKLAKSGRFQALSDRIALWRSVAASEPDHWWWRLDAMEANAASKGAWFWTGLAGLCVTVAVSLSTDVTARFFKGGPDVYGALNTFVQAVLALLAGGSFTEAGWRWLHRAVGGWTATKTGQAMARLLLAVSVLLVALMIYFTLPWVAQFYNNIGAKHRDRGSLQNAVDAFRRAVSLDPEYAEAHYNLGRVYEDLLQPDRAITEYKTAIALDPTFDRPYNNVAFLLLVEGKSNAAALDSLNRLIENLQSAKRTPDKDVRYAAYKNRGWANLALNDPDAAQTDLAEALKIDPMGASAHCLMGKALEARAAIKPDEGLAATARKHFDACVRYAPQDRSIQPTWLSEARRKMH